MIATWPEAEPRVGSAQSKPTQLLCLRLNETAQTFSKLVPNTSEGPEEFNEFLRKEPERVYQWSRLGYLLHSGLEFNEFLRKEPERVYQWSRLGYLLHSGLVWRWSPYCCRSGFEYRRH